MITLASVCKIAKTLTAKADHDESGAPTTTARLKFSELQIDRDLAALAATSEGARHERTP